VLGKRALPGEGRGGIISRKQKDWDGATASFEEEYSLGAGERMKRKTGGKNGMGGHGTM